jgi:ABC-type amino acid transport substrate-binding protein
MIYSNFTKRILSFLVCSFVFLFPFVACDFAYSAEIKYIDKILDRGYLKVGLPPYTTPPFYFNESSGELAGYDVEIIRNFANFLNVDVEFDRESTSFNDLVRRSGANDFDMAIGKLGTTYARMSDAHPHEYMNFRHSILAKRKSIANLQGNIPDSDFASVLLSSDIKLGFIGRSAYDTYATALFPNAEKIGYENWDKCKEALFAGEVDGIYRDATEVKKIVYQEPTLSLDYVPVLFEDIVDQKSIYLSTEADMDMASILDYYLAKEITIKDDSEIIAEFPDFYRPDTDSSKKSKKGAS